MGLNPWALLIVGLGLVLITAGIKGRLGALSGAVLGPAHYGGSPTKVADVLPAQGPSSSTSTTSGH